MVQRAAKLQYKDLLHYYFGRDAYVVKCPGCKSTHIFTTGFTDESERQKYISQRGDGKCPLWTFNGDLEKPTFTPSMLCTWGDNSDPDFGRVVCHSFVTDGMIRFLGDCTHELRGKTVELPEIPEYWL